MRTDPPARGEGARGHHAVQCLQGCLQMPQERGKLAGGRCYDPQAAHGEGAGGSPSSAP